MTKPSQKRAVANYRRRLRERGMSRYEVRGLDVDKELVRDVARQLAAGDAGAAGLRTELTRRTRLARAAAGRRSFYLDSDARGAETRRSGEAGGTKKAPVGKLVQRPGRAACAFPRSYTFVR